MTILIYGGSGSGKSACAEDTAVSLAGNGPLYYLATMRAYGEEGQKRVERHRAMRAGKGFCTVEQPENLPSALPRVRGGTVLLECLSNLTANEMFREAEICPTEETVRRVCEGLRLLAANTEHLVVVTNNVFEDGVRYAETTRAYLEALGRINEFAAALADTVTEVVVGIPVPIKEGKAEIKK